MDRRLFEAAWTGNVEYLLELIKEDPRMISVVALSSGETPLHVACMAGHINFVKEVMKLRKEFAWELNQDGFSPLHISAANGHIEIVQQLVKADRNLCLFKGTERRIPLHYAAIKGRVQVIRELLSASEESIADVTARGETALHLAVKNNEFEAFKVLVEHLKQFNKENVLNEKDEQGNTILHLAVSRKQYEVVDFLLKENDVTKGAVEVNSLNEKGLTALDVLQFFQSEAGDREIEEILRTAGAKRAGDLHSFAQAVVHQNQSLCKKGPSRARWMLEYFKYDKVRDSTSIVRNILLVIAILIATATYQAVLSPPGGVWPDDFVSRNNTGTDATKSHTAGMSVMGSHNPTSYSIFLFFNSIGFFTSIHMIYVLTFGFPMRFELLVSTTALIVTYDTCMTAIASSSRISLFFIIISVVIPIANVVNDYLWRPEEATLLANMVRSLDPIQSQDVSHVLSI